MTVTTPSIEASRVVAVTAVAVMVMAGIGARRAIWVVVFAIRRMAQWVVMAVGRRIEQVGAEGAPI